MRVMKCPLVIRRSDAVQMLRRANVKLSLGNCHRRPADLVDAVASNFVILIGKSTSLETPWPFGPRNRTQFSALAATHAVTDAKQNAN